MSWPTRCTLLPHDGEKGCCALCGTKLTGRRTRWCSDGCVRTFDRNHIWNMARHAALERDGRRCVRCGGTGAQRRHIQRIHVGDKWAMRQIGLEWVGDPKDYYRELQIITWVPWLEVNHIEPRVGRGYNAGCHHHLSNLETLCHGCHVAETTRQGADRRLIKKLAAPGTLFDEADA